MTTRSRSTITMLVGLLVTVGSLGATGCFGRRGFIAVGTAIDVLPSGYVSVMVGTRPFYYHRGIFYRPYRRGFVVVPAPIGVWVPMPPPGAVITLVENDPFHYYRGTFYAPRDGRYLVVRPPVGAFVRSVPASAATRRIDGVEYKEYAGTYYRPAIQDGRRGYQVSEPPTATRR